MKMIICGLELKFTLMLQVVKLLFTVYNEQTVN